MADKQYNGKQLTISEGDGESTLYITKRLVEYNMQKVPLDGKLTLEQLNVILKDTELVFGTPGKWRKHYNVK